MKNEEEVKVTSQHEPTDSEIVAELRKYIAVSYKGMRRSHIKAQAEGNKGNEKFCDGAMATMSKVLEILRGGKPV